MDNESTQLWTVPAFLRQNPPARSIDPPEQRLTALITGATDGIGEAVSCRLAGIVDTLLIHGRCSYHLGALAATLAPANPGTSIVPVMADLNSFADVRRLARSVRRTFDHLDILVNNAGTAGQYPHRLTEDGHELTFQVNYLSPVLLTADLFDLLRAARCGRVVNVVCDLYRHAKTVNEDSSDSRRYHPLTAYAQSKFALAAHTASLARAVSGTPCDAVCLDPGIADTKLRRKSVGLPGAAVAEAADNVLYAATMPPSPRGFYVQKKRLVQPEPEVLDVSVQRRLDSLTEELVDIPLPWFAASRTGGSSACL